MPQEHMSSPPHAILWQIATERSYAGHAEFDALAIVNQVRDEHPDYPTLADRARDYAVKYGFGTIGVVAETLAEEISKGHAARETEKKLLAAWQRLAAGQDQAAREVMTSIDPDAGVRDHWVTLADAWESAKT